MEAENKDFSMTLAPRDGYQMSKAQKAQIQEYILLLKAQRTPERLMRNELLAERYLKVIGMSGTD